MQATAPTIAFAKRMDQDQLRVNDAQRMCLIIDIRHATRRETAQRPAFKFLH